MTLNRLSLIFLCATQLATPAATQTTDFGNAVTMGTVADVKLTAAQRRAVKWYRSNKAYFGAFYVVPGTKHVFWTRNFHSFQTAKAAAQKGCELSHKTKNCVLYAVQYPKGTDPNDPSLAGLGQRASKNFERKYLKKQKDGKYGAFAINGAFGYGFSFNNDTLAEAKDTALAYCKAHSSNTMAPIGSAARKWATQKGLDKCHIIHTHSPATK